MGLYADGLYDAVASASRAGAGKHWAKLRLAGTEHALAALRDWGTITAADTTHYRKLFKGLPARPACAKPKIQYKPRMVLPSMNAFLIELKNRIMLKMGIYVMPVIGPGTPGTNAALATMRADWPPRWGKLIPEGKWIPCTSVALMTAVGKWVWATDVDPKTPVGSKASATWERAALAAYLERAQKYLDAEATRRGFAWGTAPYEDLAKALVLPPNMVNGFWQLCQRIGTRIDSGKYGDVSFWSKLLAFRDKAWDVTRKGVKWTGGKLVDATTAIAKGGRRLITAATGLSWDWLKWVLLAALLVGGLVVLKHYGMLGS